jgi:hypothetical protein
MSALARMRKGVPYQPKAAVLSRYASKSSTTGGCGGGCSINPNQSGSGRLARRDQQISLAAPAEKGR